MTIILTEKEINSKSLIHDVSKEEEVIQMAVEALAKQSEDKLIRQAYQRRRDEIYFYNKERADDMRRLEEAQKKIEQEINRAEQEKNRAEQEKNRAEQEKNRAEQAENRAEQAEARIEKLLQQLIALQANQKA